MRKLSVLFAMTLLTGYVFSQHRPTNPDDSIFNSRPPVLLDVNTKYCLENDSVYHYMNDFSYDTIPDLNVSYILRYYDPETSFRCDWPKPVSLSWTNQSEAESRRIEISVESDFSDSLVYKVGQDADAYDVYNLIPGLIYYYRVVAVKADQSEVVEDSGSFETTGTLRMLRADGTLNVRDMGGWTGLGGHKIAYGKLFRGGHLKADGANKVLLTDEGIAAMRDAGIRAELDLRSSSNVPNRESALAVKDENGKSDVDFNLVPESVDARMVNFDANDSGIREIQWIIKELKAGKPVFYHCSMGADRTGTLGFLLGALFGMSDGDLAKDYEITTFCSKYTGEDGYEHFFARFRNYTGKWGSPDSRKPEEYMFAPVIDKLQKMSGSTTQRKIYTFLKNGVGNTKIPEKDLDWLIEYMVDYKMVKKVNLKASTNTLSVGEQVQLEPSRTPVDATDSVFVFKSLDENVVKVSQDGVVTAVGAGTTYVFATVDNVSKSLKLTVTDSGTTVSDIQESVPADEKIYSTSGQEIDVPGGMYIRNGKTYYDLNQ